MIEGDKLFNFCPLLFLQDYYFPSPSPFLSLYYHIFPRGTILLYLPFSWRSSSSLRLLPPFLPSFKYLLNGWCSEFPHLRPILGHLVMKFFSRGAFSVFHECTLSLFSSNLSSPHPQACSHSKNFLGLWYLFLQLQVILI